MTEIDDALARLARAEERELKIAEWARRYLVSSQTFEHELLARQFREKPEYLINQLPNYAPLTSFPSDIIPVAHEICERVPPSSDDVYLLQEWHQTSYVRIDLPQPQPTALIWGGKSGDSKSEIRLKERALRKALREFRPIESSVEERVRADGLSAIAHMVSDDDDEDGFRFTVLDAGDGRRFARWDDRMRDPRSPATNAPHRWASGSAAKRVAGAAAERIRRHRGLSSA